MRTLAIGDVHGCAVALDAILDMVRPAADDVVVLLGDYVDRGPDSKGVIERVLALRGACRVVPLLGNHEEMMLDARDGGPWASAWREHFGRETLRSYGSLERVPESHWRLLDAECVPYHETEGHIFVHATLDPDLALEDQPVEWLRWRKLVVSRPHRSGKIMVCGHTPQTLGKPLDLGHAVCIDTYAYGGGWLSCFEPQTGRVWQASEEGERRELGI